MPTRCCAVVLAGALSLVGVPGLAHLALIRQGAESWDVPESVERFGEAVATGDFNSDGFDDLATGTPNEDNAGSHGDEQHGAVVINPGSAFGLTHEGAYGVSIGFVTDPTVRFGQALAVGNFNGDFYDDLAVGAPYYDDGAATDAGAVFVYLGGANGLDPTPQVVLRQGDLGVGEVSETLDLFGWALATGDFDDDGLDELVIGSPGEDNFIGIVCFVSGAQGVGLDPGAGAGVIRQSDVGNTEFANERFGLSLATGALVGTSHTDLAIGSPFDTPGEPIQNGRVFIVPGSASGLDPAAGTHFTAFDLGAPASVHQGGFGWSLAIGRIAHSAGLNGNVDLAISEPDYPTNGIAESGRVLITQPSGPAPVIVLDQETPSDAQETIEENDKFGWALAAGDLDNDGYDDLAVGTPDEERDYDRAGSVSFFYGGNHLPDSTAGLDMDCEYLFDRNDEQNEMGYALAFGKFDQSDQLGLAIGAPATRFRIWANEPPGFPEIGHGQVHVYAPHRQVFQLRSRSACVLNCNDDIIFSQRMFDPVPTASTAKVMTNWIASDLIVNSAMMADSTLPYVVDEWIAGCVNGSTADLQTGEAFVLIELMKMMIGASGNDAALSVADRVTGASWEWPNECVKSADEVPSFVDMMNTRAANTGMVGTNFSNPTGLDWPLEGPTPVSTAHDMALLTRGTVQNPIAVYMMGTEKFTIDRANSELTDFEPGLLEKLRKNINNAVVTGSKAGLTPRARNAGVAAGNAMGETDAIATIFGVAVEPDQNSNDSWNWRNDMVAQLLVLGINSCPGNPGDADADPTSTIPVEPCIDKQGIPTTSGSAQGVVKDLCGIAGDMLVEVLPQHLPFPDADVELCAKRSMSFAIDPGSSVSLSVAPFERQEGLRLSNEDTTAADLQITHNQPVGSSFPLLLAAQADSLVLGPTSLATRSFSFEIMNLSMVETALISVEEVGFCFDVALATYADQTSIAFDVTGVPGFDNGIFTITGLDSAGSNLVRLVVRAPGVPVPTDVADLPGPAAVDGGPSIAWSRTQPNPALRSISVAYELSRPTQVNIAVYDLRGRLVKRLPSGWMPAGRRSVVWDRTNESGIPVAAGLYFVRIAAQQDSRVSRVLVLK